MLSRSMRVSAMASPWAGAYLSARARKASSSALHVDHVGDVLVGPRHLLGEPGERSCAHRDAPCGELAHQIDATSRLLRLRPTHHAPRSVAGGAERLGHRARRAEEEERVAAHVAGDDDGLTERAEMRRELRMSRAEG